MLDLNLLNPELKSNLRRLEIFHLLRRVLIYVFITTIVLSISLFLSFTLLRENLKQIELRIENEKNLSTKQSNISMDEIIKSLNTQLTQINDIQSKYIKWSKVLNNFNSIVPSKVSLNLIEFNSIAKTFRVTGTSSDRQVLLNFQESLGKFPYLKDLYFPLSNLAQQNNINFEISGKLTDSIHE